MTNIKTAQSEVSLPNGYVWAKDEDFEWKTSHLCKGFWHYIGTDEKVAIPHTIQGKEVTSYEFMFHSTSVSGVYSDNPNVSNMSCMFYFSEATSLDLTYLDTSNVTDMSFMFNYSQANTLGLSNFNTSNVTNMCYMFSRSPAKTLDLSSFDTSKVIDMEGIFYKTQVNTLDLSSFDISNAIYMSYMFYGSKVTECYVRTQSEADRVKSAQEWKMPLVLKFIVKPKM